MDDQFPSKRVVNEPGLPRILINLLRNALPELPQELVFKMATWFYNNTKNALPVECNVFNNIID